MNRQQTIYTILFWIIIVLFSYIVILQPKVKASEEMLQIQQQIEELKLKNKQLELDKKEESDWWWVDEDAKAECIQSWEQHQDQRNQNNIQREKEIKTNSWTIAKLEEKLGLLLQR